MKNERVGPSHHPLFSLSLLFFIFCTHLLYTQHARIFCMCSCGACWSYFWYTPRDSSRLLLSPLLPSTTTSLGPVKNRETCASRQASAEETRKGLSRSEQVPRTKRRGKPPPPVVIVVVVVVALRSKSIVHLVFSSRTDMERYHHRAARLLRASAPASSLTGGKSEVAGLPFARKRTAQKSRQALLQKRASRFRTPIRRPRTCPDRPSRGPGGRRRRHCSRGRCSRRTPLRCPPHSLLLPPPDQENPGPGSSQRSRRAC